MRWGEAAGKAAHLEDYLVCTECGLRDLCGAADENTSPLATMAELFDSGDLVDRKQFCRLTDEFVAFEELHFGGTGDGSNTYVLHGPPYPGYEGGSFDYLYDYLDLPGTASGALGTFGDGEDSVGFTESASGNLVASGAVATSDTFTESADGDYSENDQLGFTATALGGAVVRGTVADALHITFIQR
jgi:hypothetical protein